MPRARRVLALLACAAANNEFNTAISQGLLSELELELAAPWSTLDFDAAMVERGAALK